MFTSEGVIDVCGRPTYYITKPTFKYGRWRWFCKVTDQLSGIQARADDYESKLGARKHAVVNLADKLADNGILQR